MRKIPMPPSYQVIGFWFSMPFICLAYCYILYGDRIFHDYRPWIVVYPIVYGIGYFSWRAHYVYDHWVRNKFPSLKETRKRVLYTMPVNLLVMTPSVLLIVYVFHWFQVLGYQIGPGDIKYAYLVGLTINIIFESLWEVMYIIEKYKESASERQIIEQMQLRQEFDNLKQKVNPHFLFNSFNTLSSLILEDKNQAEKFLDELSKVYRYLLRNNESGMSTVGQELKFIQSYAQLLTTRHGEGFRLEVNVDPAYRDREIPSLTLQLLVENAVKHNVLTKQHPVQVIIYSTPDEYLVVNNNLNKKTRLVNESTGIGLVNIREKYRLLNRPDVRVEETHDRFTVSIPLLA